MLASQAVITSRVSPSKLQKVIVTYSVYIIIILIIISNNGRRRSGSGSRITLWQWFLIYWSEFAHQPILWQTQNGHIRQISLSQYCRNAAGVTFSKFLWSNWKTKDPMHVWGMSLEKDSASIVLTQVWLNTRSHPCHSALRWSPCVMKALFQV